MRDSNELLRDPRTLLSSAFTTFCGCYLCHNSQSGYLLDSLVQSTSGLHCVFPPSGHTSSPLSGSIHPAATYLASLTGQASVNTISPIYNGLYEKIIM